MFRTVIAADWGLSRRKRAVAIAELGARRVSALEPPPGGWDLGALLARADTSPGPVLVGVDLALGLPRGISEGVAFLDWLAGPAGERALAEEAPDASRWSPETPFFRVPPGRGSLGAFREAAASAGVTLSRELDRSLGGASPLILSGIPGSVGSGTRAFWRELRPRLAPGRPFSVWPFDAPSGGPVICELYPAIACSVVVGAALPAPRVRVAKTRAWARDAVLDALRAAPWVSAQGVRVEGLERARLDEDAFDALVTATAALRCMLEGFPLLVPPATAPAEGAVLLTGAVQSGRGGGWFGRVGRPAGLGAPARSRGHRGRVVAAAPPRTCPIDGCGHVFRRGRSGWDGHVGARGRHPAWCPELSEPAARRARFRSEFVDWFSDP